MLAVKGTCRSLDGIYPFALYDQNQPYIPYTSMPISKEKSKHILIVEDNSVIQKLHLIYLRKLRHNATIASQGHKVLSCDLTQYDLILLDIGLPDISGVEVCQTIRASSNNPNIPIIFLTGRMDQVAEKCKTAAANDFLIKPVYFEDLTGLLQKWLPAADAVSSAH